MYQLEQKINRLIEEELDEKFNDGDVKNTGLDDRACGRCWFSNDYFVIPAGSQRRLEYYGGFEYVDREYVRVFGDYVFYSTEDERVMDVISSLLDAKETADA